MLCNYTARLYWLLLPTNCGTVSVLLPSLILTHIPSLSHSLTHKIWSLTYSLPLHLSLSVCLSLSLLEDMELLRPEVPFLLQFMDHVAKDEERSDGVTACCAGLLGYVDVISVLFPGYFDPLCLISGRCMCC